MGSQWLHMYRMTLYKMIPKIKPMSISTSFYIESFYTYVPPLGSHVGAQLLVCFCIFNVDLMMTARRSKHVVFYDYS